MPADSQLSISPPGLERLQRMIDTATLEARVVVTAASNTQTINATATTSSELNRTASVQVPHGVPFSIEVIWSVMGVDASRVDYAIFRKDYSATEKNISINVSPEQYDLSAAAFDSDNDGISNFEELEAGTLTAGDPPLADRAVAYYPLDFGQANDSSGNNRNGEVIVGVPAADESGAIDAAMRLGNSMEHVSIPASVVDGLRDFSILFKVNFDIFNEGEFQYNTIFSIASQQEHSIAFGYANSFTAFPMERQFFLASEGGGDIPVTVIFERMDTITTNRWYCVAIYRQGGAVGLVVDGELIGDDEEGFTLSAINADEGGFVIGQQQAGSIGAFFDSGKALAGIIDEFYVFDNAVASQDIQNFCD